jgi:thioredoxin 1
MEHLSASDFKAKIFDYEKSKEWNYAGELPAIIDFYTQWCGPCKMVAPVLESLAAEYEGKLNIYKVDTDKEPELSAVFGIQSVPSILFVPLKGQPQMAMGALPKASFQSAIKDVLGVEA